MAQIRTIHEFVAFLPLRHGNTGPKSVFALVLPHPLVLSLELPQMRLLEVSFIGTEAREKSVKKNGGIMKDG